MPLARVTSFQVASGYRLPQQSPHPPSLREDHGSQSFRPVNSRPVSLRLIFDTMGCRGAYKVCGAYFVHNGPHTTRMAKTLT
eukprot:5372263-Pyramimonas_sp.AAC.1